MVRLLVGRLQWHIMQKLQVTQYGFTPQRGTEDALYDLMTYICKELNFKKIILIVSLDIEGAFDNVWWLALKTQLLAHKCPVNLFGMVRGCLRDWEVNCTVRWKGVQAFADHMILMFSEQSAVFVEEEVNRVLAHINCWRVNNKLRTPAARKLGVRKMLDTVQRIVALKACRAHRTVSRHSMLILSRLLCFDFRVREAAWLYEMKCGKDLGDTFYEKPVYFSELSHPAHELKIGFESVEKLDSNTLDSPWSGRGDDSLQRTIRRVKKGKDGLVNIFSDFRSALAILNGSKTYRLLAHEARHNISEIFDEGGAVLLFRVKAHARIERNERADELDRRATLIKKTAADYDKFPLSYAKSERRVWRSIRNDKPSETPFAQYLFRFKMKDSPCYACDPTKIQDVLHVLEDCDMVHCERVGLDSEIDARMTRQQSPKT